MTQTLDLPTLESWLWDAACSIRGAIDAPKYKEYILPLLFYKRLSDVYADEIDRVTREIGDADLARELVADDRSLTRVYIPDAYTWDAVRRDPTDLGDRLTTAVREIAKENPDLKDVIDISDYNATTAGQRILPDGQLAELIEILNRYRLGLRDVEPDILGRAYEYLLRKFAEGSGQSAGEFYTPMTVATLMSYILDPQEGESLYDPACGSTGLLIKSQLRLREKIAHRLGVDDPHDLTTQQLGRPLQLFGQEVESFTYAMGRMNAFLHDMDAEIAQVYLEWQEVEELSAIVSEEEVARNDYNLSPSRYVVIDDTEPVLPLEEALVLLEQAEEARAEADADLEGVLRELGF